MIKRLYKRIRLYHINKTIKKIQAEIQIKLQRINWIKNHIHDVNIIYSTNELNNVILALKYDQMILDNYIQDKERIEAL